MTLSEIVGPWMAVSFVNEQRRVCVSWTGSKEQRHRLLQASVYVWAAALDPLVRQFPARSLSTTESETGNPNLSCQF